MARAVEVLKAHESTEKSNWREQAQWQNDNWDWLKHSLRIALQIRDRMKNLGWTQKELAEKMGCSQQYVSLILKGRENLTLETIAKMEKVLEIDLIVNHPHYLAGYDVSTSERPYLSEPDETQYGER